MQMLDREKCISGFHMIATINLKFKGERTCKIKKNDIDAKVSMRTIE